jgi:hypothetical protein
VIAALLCALVASSTPTSTPTPTSTSSPTATSTSSVTVVPLLHQGLVFLSSDEVTGGGLGGGAGAQAVWRDRVVLQADVSVLWGAGNAVVARLAAGVQRRGRFSPALLATAALLGGQRIEFLDEGGRGPPAPSWAAGLRAAPLRFTGGAGFVSALEAGAALGPAGGLWLELGLLTAGVRW